MYDWKPGFVAVVLESSYLFSQYPGMCQAGPRYPYHHEEAVVCASGRWLRTSDGLDGDVELREGDQTYLRETPTYPICVVSLLWVLFIYVMITGLHYTFDYQST